MRLWLGSKKGPQNIWPTNTGRDRLNLNGTYNLNTQDVIIHHDLSINTQSTIKLLDQIQAHYPDKVQIYVILDNVKYYRSRLVQNYVK